MKSSIDLIRKTFLLERFTRKSFHYRFCFSRSQHPNSTEFRVEERFRPGQATDSCYVLNRDETTLLAPRGRFERCFPKGILTYCFNNVGVLFLKGPVSSSFQSATLYLAQRTARLHSTTDSVVCRKFHKS